MLESRSDFLRYARESGHPFFAEAPAYLTNEKQSSEEIAKRVNKKYPSEPISPFEVEVVLNSIADGNNPVQRIPESGKDEDGKVYFLLKI